MDALAWDQPARTRTLCPPGLSASRGRFPPSTTSGDMRRSWWLPNALCTRGGTAGPSLPPAQAHPTRRTALAPRHSQRRVKGSRSHLCLVLHQPLQALLGAECLPLGRRERVEGGEQRRLCCSAGGPALGDSGQTRETLTPWRRLSSFCRSLMDGTVVTRAPVAPSGVLSPGKDRERAG